MKRFLVWTMLMALLLCGCNTATPEMPVDDPAQTQAPTAAQTTATTPSSTAPTATPSDPAQTVTVYLLDEAIFFDSGSASCQYDEQYNIDTCTVYTIENSPMYTIRFEEKNANGMAGRYHTEWENDGGEYIRTLTWLEDGNLKEEQYEPGFSGCQYAYDPQGRMTEKREYYDGILENTTYYEYDGDTLKASYTEDVDGNRRKDYRVENGRIIEEVIYDSDGSFCETFEYDKNGNPIRTTLLYDGENTPGTEYSYKVVQVSADRARYLQKQQQHLISML